jgi:cytochrome b
MKRIKLSHMVDLVLFVQLLLVGGTGLIMYFYPQAAGHSLRFIHDQIGLLMLVFFAIHMALNWKWIVATTTKFGKKGKKIKENYLVDLALFIQFLLVGGSGLIMYFYHHAGGSMLRLIHDQIGVLMVVFFVVHVALHWKWIGFTTKKLFLKEKEFKNDRTIKRNEQGI